VIYIATYAIREGELERFRQFLHDVLEQLEANEPGAISADAYVADDGRQAAVVLRGTDTDSIRNYWRVVHQHTGRALQQFADPTAVQVYGPSAGIAPERRHGAGADGTLTVMSEYVGGFFRLSGEG
jgi:hypothetical protein